MAWFETGQEDHQTLASLRAARTSEMTKTSDSRGALDKHITRALNKIRKPSTVEEIAALLNHELDPGDRVFQTKEVAEWLRNAEDKTLTLYWLRIRPRR